MHYKHILYYVYIQRYAFLLDLFLIELTSINFYYHNIKKNYIKTLTVTIPAMTKEIHTIVVHYV